MNNDIARFAKTAILFIVILIAFDRLLGYALKKFYFSQKSINRFFFYISSNII